jgi:uncharacterized protein
MSPAFRASRWLQFGIAVVTIAAVWLPLARGTASTAFAQRIGDRDPSGITVSGEGEVRAEPDIAVVTAGVTHQAPSSQDAMDEVSRRLTAVIAAARALGIESRDIQTTGLSLSPIYRQRPRGDEVLEIEAYRASNNVSLTVRDLRRTSAVLDAVLANGANNIGGLRFSFSNPEQLRLQALANAVANAESKAQAMASAAGVGISGIMAIQEESVSFPTGAAQADFARAAPALAPAPAPPVESGEMVIRARVRVSYGL